MNGHIEAVAMQPGTLVIGGNKRQPVSCLEAETLDDRRTHAASLTKSQGSVPKTVMSPKDHPLKHARSLVRVAAAAGATAGVLLGAELHSLRTGNDGEATRLWKTRWARAMLQLLRVDVGVSGSPRFRGGRPRLIVANHRSALDIPVLLHLFDTHFLSRGDLEKWPLVGHGASRVGTIFVDRKNKASGAAAIRAIHRRLATGSTVLVFPEGTTHPGDEVRDFHGGAFSSVKGLDAEIIPVGLAYEPGAEFTEPSFGGHALNVVGRSRSHVSVCVGEPQVLTGTTREAAKHFRGVVQSLVDRARGEHATHPHPIK